MKIFYESFDPPVRLLIDIVCGNIMMYVAEEERREKNVADTGNGNYCRLLYQAVLSAGYRALFDLENQRKLVCRRSNELELVISDYEIATQHANCRCHCWKSFIKWFLLHIFECLEDLS